MLFVSTGEQPNRRSLANGGAEKSAAHLDGHALRALLDEMEQYLMQLRRVSTGKQIAALENSVRDARQRLHSQHQNMIHNAPTESIRDPISKR